MLRRNFLKSLGLTAIAITSPLSFAHKIPWYPKTADELYQAMNAMFDYNLPTTSVLGHIYPLEFAKGIWIYSEDPSVRLKAEEKLARSMWWTAQHYYRLGCRSIFWRVNPEFTTEKSFNTNITKGKLYMRVGFLNG